MHLAIIFRDSASAFFGFRANAYGCEAFVFHLGKYNTKEDAEESALNISS